MILAIATPCTEVLWQVTDPVGQEAADATDPDPAVGDGTERGLEDAGEQAQQGRLAGPVGTQDTDHAFLRPPAGQGAVETFLCGAGLPEHGIEYFRSLIGKPAEFYSCFISYNHEDRAFARWLHDALQTRGIRCWLDEHEMLPGDDIYEAVDRGIRIWDKVLLCASEKSLKSRWVDDEIAKALQKEQELQKQRGQKVKVIITLNLDGYMLRDAYQGGFKATLTRRLAADFTGWEHYDTRFEEQLERVVAALRTEREEPPEAKL